MDAESLAIFPMWYVVFLLSVTCHEAAHALAAKWGGDLTAYHAGQVSLSPVPHVQREPWGMVVMPILSMLMGGTLMGWGSAPYDPYWEQRYPRRAAWMALAGPAANLLLVLLAAALIKAGFSAGVLVKVGDMSFTQLVGSRSGPVWDGIARFLSILFCQNVLLGFFNLLPVPPLDGNSVITLLMPQAMAEKFREVTRQGFLAMFGIWIAWFVASPFIIPILRVAITTLIY